MSVTQKAIADRLNMSPQQVGFALRGTGTVSERTREKVRRVAEEMGYHAHSNVEARALAARRYGQRVHHGVIGCAQLGDSVSAGLPYWLQVQNGVLEAANKAGYELMLLPIESYRGWEKVDGILTVSDTAAALYHDLPVKMPFVSIMQAGKGISSVVADDADGVCQAVEHLVGLGHRRIAYLLWIESVTGSTKQRLAAYRRALKNAGITPQKNWVKNLTDMGDFVNRGRYCMNEWLNSGWKDLGCTALLVQNDRAAMGAIQALYEVGIRVPQDVSVVGFDGTTECDLIYPRLTSIKVPLREIGSLSMEMLLRQINGETQKNEECVMPTHLEIRESTAPPK